MREYQDEKRSKEVFEREGRQKEVVGRQGGSRMRSSINEREGEMK